MCPLKTEKNKLLIKLTFDTDAEKLNYLNYSHE